MWVGGEADLSKKRYGMGNNFMYLNYVFALCVCAGSASNTQGTAIRDDFCRVGKGSCRRARKGVRTFGVGRTLEEG